MAEVVILKKSGAAIRTKVMETAETIYFELSDTRQEEYSGRYFRKSDFILLVKEDGKKVIINKRYICYATD